MDMGECVNERVWVGSVCFEHGERRWMAYPIQNKQQPPNRQKKDVHASALKAPGSVIGQSPPTNIGYRLSAVSHVLALSWLGGSG